MQLRVPTSELRAAGAPPDEAVLRLVADRDRPRPGEVRWRCRRLAPAAGPQREVQLGPEAAAALKAASATLGRTERELLRAAFAYVAGAPLPARIE